MNLGEVLREQGDSVGAIREQERLHGLARPPGGPLLARRPVAYGDVLVTVSADVALGASAAESAATATAAQGLVFRAPTSGRFYGRPTPEKPAFVEVGAELTSGTTVCGSPAQPPWLYRLTRQPSFPAASTTGTSCSAAA